MGGGDKEGGSSRIPEQARKQDVQLSLKGDIFTPERSAALPAKMRQPAEIPPEEYELLRASYELLHAKNERRKQKDRQRMARRRRENPEEYRAYQREYMKRRYWAKKRQEAESAGTDDSQQSTS